MPLFVARADPLPAVAVAALGRDVRGLAKRLLLLPDDTLAHLSGVAGQNAAVVLGAPEALPWFDGALYLGAGGALLWPTWAQPATHPVLLERALRRTMKDAATGPLALLIPSFEAAASPLIVPLGGARPLSREKLTALAEAA
jgi:hypothetical protein